MLSIEDEAPSEPVDSKRRAPSETYAGIEPAPLPPMAPDGGPMPMPIGPPAPIPAATPELFVCLRGPCRHYWELESHLESGNPKLTWDAELGLKDEAGKPIRQPRQITRSCKLQPGIDTDLTDNLVYRCNQWDPIPPTQRDLTGLEVTGKIPPARSMGLRAEIDQAHRLDDSAFYEHRDVRRRVYLSIYPQHAASKE